MKDNQKIDIQEILESAKTVGLTAVEKSSMREDLSKIINSTSVVSPYLGNKQNVFWSFSYLKHFHYVPLALILFVVLGGGASFASKNSLPGDILYPMKIHVNENLESFLAVSSPKSLAEVSAELATRRVIEAEILATNGNLTPEKNIELRNNFNKQVDLLNARLLKLEEKGDKKSADDVQSKFEMEVESHIVSDSKPESVAASASVALMKSSISDEDDIWSFFRTKSREGRRGENDVMSTTSFSAKVKVEDEDSDDEEESRDFDDEDGEDEGEDEDDDSGAIITPSATTTSSTTTSSNVTKFTIVQVAKHNTKTDCYTAISGGVYNLTSWIAQHPGGSAAIISLCGIDGTSAFLAQHKGQGNPAQELASFKIGVLQ